MLILVMVRAVCSTMYYIFIDINECNHDSLHNCTHNCHNVEGTHYCSCDSGYGLDDDGFNCTGTTYITHVILMVLI